MAKKINKLCDNCHNKCDMPCIALTELFDIYSQQRNKDKANLIRRLKYKLGIRDYEPDKELQKLGKAIIKKFPEFDFINDYGIRIGYVKTEEVKSGEKTTYADTRKVTDVYQAYLPFDFVITFYGDVEFLSDKQRKLLMYHELRHIEVGTKGYKVRQHEVEDFRNILELYGINWMDFNNETVPDILGSGLK